MTGGLLAPHRADLPTHRADDSILDRIGIACTYIPFTGAAFPLRDIGGGGGGDPFGDYCPPGYVIHGIDVRHGSWVDREQAQCVRLAP